MAISVDSSVERQIFFAEAKECETRVRRSVQYSFHGCLSPLWIYMAIALRVERSVLRLVSGALVHGCFVGRVTHIACHIRGATNMYEKTAHECVRWWSVSR